MCVLCGDLKRIISDIMRQQLVWGESQELKNHFNIYNINCMFTVIWITWMVLLLEKTLSVAEQFPSLFRAGCQGIYTKTKKYRATTITK